MQANCSRPCGLLALKRAATSPGALTRRQSALRQSAHEGTSPVGRCRARGANRYSDCQNKMYDEDHKPLGIEPRGWLVRMILNEWRSPASASRGFAAPAALRG